MLFSFFENGINSLVETEGEYDEFIQQLNLPSRSSISELWLQKINIFLSVLLLNIFLIFSAPVADFYEEIAASLSDDEGKKVRRNINKEYYNENELKLQCCVLMLDVILKQVRNDEFLHFKLNILFTNAILLFFRFTRRLLYTISNDSLEFIR